MNNNLLEFKQNSWLPKKLRPEQTLFFNEVFYRMPSGMQFYSNLGQGPLFVYVDGTPLTRDKLVETVRHMLQQAGVSPVAYSSHRFRIRAATTAAQAGLEDSVIKMLGRWEFTAYQHYIRTPRETLAAISAYFMS